MADAAHGADAAYGADAAHGGGGMPQLDFDTWASQIFWVALALFILYRLLVRRILPQISSSLEERHNAIVDDLDRAARYRRDVEERQEALDAAIKSARDKAQLIAADAKAKVQAELAEAMAEADQRIADQLQAGEERIAEIRASAKDDVRSVAAEAAEAIMGRLAPDLQGSDALGKAVAEQVATHTGGR